MDWSDESNKSDKFEPSFNHKFTASFSAAFTFLNKSDANTKSLRFC